MKPHIAYRKGQWRVRFRLIAADGEILHKTYLAESMMHAFVFARDIEERVCQ